MPKYAQDELRDVVKRITATANAARDKENTFASGRLGYKHPISDTSDLELGLMGHYAKGKDYKDVGLDRADLKYSKRFKDESELRARFGANLNKNSGKRGVDEFGVEYEIPFKKGGRVKGKAKSASQRGDGCAKRGKTRGKIR